jgi:6-phosphogluconolactonase
VRSPEILIAGTDDLADCAAETIERTAAAACVRRGRLIMAIAGGSIARAFFPRLARAEVDWHRVEIFFADERAVLPQDPASNYGIARELWFGPAGVPPERVHQMFRDGIADPVAAVEAYTGELHAVAGTPPRLDLALLGVGADGHVASVFPAHPALASRRSVVFVADAPKPPARRMTLTLPVLASSQVVLFGAFGDAKRRAVSQALHDPVAVTPAALLARTTARAIWLLDPECGADWQRSC